jgi:hypothetical protein
MKVIAPRELPTEPPRKKKKKCCQIDSYLSFENCITYEGFKVTSLEQLSLAEFSGE